MPKINEKGVLIFYDWLDRLKEARLPDTDALSIIYALADYSRYREDPVEKVDVSLKYAVGLMVDQIKRAEETAEVNKLKAQKRWQNKAIQSNTEQCTAIQSNPTNTNTDTQTNTDTDTSTPIVPLNGRLERDYIGERFDEFWKVYPKKVGKEAARKAFAKIRPTAELFKVMLDGIERSKKSQQWQEEQGRFIQNPSTWLNQGRWEDELTEASEVKKPKDEKPRHGDFDTTAALERAIAKSFHMFEETEG
jgi:hypothetical protein